MENSPIYYGKNEGPSVVEATWKKSKLGAACFSSREEDSAGLSWEHRVGGQGDAQTDGRPDSRGRRGPRPVTPAQPALEPGCLFNKQEAPFTDSAEAGPRTRGK